MLVKARLLFLFASDTFSVLGVIWDTPHNADLSLLPHSSHHVCVFSVPGSVTMFLLTRLLRLWGVILAAVFFVASYSPHQQQWYWSPLPQLVLTCCRISSHTSQGVIPVNHHLQDVIFLVLLQTLPHILHLLDKLRCHQMSLFLFRGISNSQTNIKFGFDIVKTNSESVQCFPRKQRVWKAVRVSSWMLLW